MTQQPTNPEHFWRYHSSLETQPAGHNISALGDYHQWTNPTFIIPSEREELIRREAEQYGDGANGDSITDLQLSWGRSFIPDNYSSSSDQFLSSSGSFNLMRGLDPDMSSGGDQQWRLSATSSLACNHMLLHHPLSTQTSSSTNSHKMGGLVGSHGISEAAAMTKRPAAAASFYESKESQTDAKKSRCSSTSRSSSSSSILKVRKEKLGDRIAALQKLVAPFGKTDTASVLTEAIGYIQFLHNQVQRLSVPYMKSTGRAVQVSSRQEEGKEEQKAGLQSRGLCLVPHSWASFLDSSSFGF